MFFCEYCKIILKNICEQLLLCKVLKASLSLYQWNSITISCHWSLSRPPENQRFSFLMFPVVKKRPVTWNGLISIPKQVIQNRACFYLYVFPVTEAAAFSKTRWFEKFRRKTFRRKNFRRKFYRKTSVLRSLIKKWLQHKCLLLRILCNF